MNEEPREKLLTCEDCGIDFLFTAGEQEFYARMNFIEPKRCGACRRACRPHFLALDRERVR